MALRSRPYDLSGIALIAAGFVLVALVIGGYALGALLDARYGTSPFGAMIGLFAGLLVGLWELYAIATRLLARQPRISPPQASEQQEDEADVDNE